LERRQAIDVQAVKPRIGVFGIGLAAYWPQFSGLKERLEGYQREVESRIADFGAEVISADLVDSALSARDAGAMLARADTDLLVCYVGTYATSSQVLPIVQKARVPVLVLNLQPVAALDYENTDTGEWLANCSTCCVPEISNAFTRARIDFHVVSGMLRGDDNTWRDIGQWCRAAAVARAMRHARIGFLGHTYPGMLDMYSDFTAVHAQLGAHVEVLEMDDLAERVAAVTDTEVEAKLAEVRSVFDLAENVVPGDLDWPARVAIGLDSLASDFDLNGLTYYYRGLAGNEFERLGAGLILGNSLLTGRGIPASGEGDLKTCIAMLMMDRFEAGGSYTEFYAMDFNEGFVLMGHDGPGHIAISDRKPVLRSLGLYHGKRGHGVSVEFNVKTGPITVVGLTQDADGRFKMLAAEGESLPGPILKIGNTNSRLRFSLPPAEFVNRWCEQGPTHHCALGVGHRLEEFRKLSKLIDVPLVAIGASGGGC
jgi:L-arabinose isomerase